MTDRDAGGAANARALLGDEFLRRLERLALRSRRVVGASGGRPGQRRTPAADFVDHRAYTPGDDQRHIDWPAVARHDEVFVKVGRAPQAAHVHLVLDVSASMTTCAGKRRMSLQLTAALGWLSLVHGDRVSLLPFPETATATRWGPASGGGSGAAFLAHLTALGESPSPRTELAPALGRLARRAATGGLVVVVSDLWVADDLDVALGGLPVPPWQVMVLQVLDRTELDPVLAGELELRDAESGASIVLDVDDGIRSAYRAALGGRLERLGALAVSRGADHVLIPADWSLERAVIPFLRRQSLLAG